MITFGQRLPKGSQGTVNMREMGFQEEAPAGQMP